MKLKIVLLALLSSTLGFSQEVVTQAVTKTMSKGAQPGIAVFIPKISDDNLEDAIKEVTKPYDGKQRKIKRSNETYIDDATINEISSNTIDIHQTIEKGDDGYTYTAFFNLGGVFLDNAYSPEKFSYAVDLVKRIAEKAVANKNEDVLKSENKTLDNLEDDKKKLEKNIDKDTRDIQDAKDVIAKREREIEGTKKQIENKTIEIEKQRQFINSIMKK